MFFARFDNDLRVADFLNFRREQRNEFFARLGRNTSGTAVGDNAFGIKRRKISARADVAGFQFKTKAERFNDAATDLKFQRIVAEQAEMAGAAAGREAGRNGNHAALRGILRKLVEVGRVRGFERREIAGFLRRNVAESVENNQRVLGFGFKGQLGIK